MRTPALFLRAVATGLRPAARHRLSPVRFFAAPRAASALPLRRSRFPPLSRAPSVGCASRTLWTTRAVSAPPPPEERTADAGAADAATAAPGSARDARQAGKDVLPPLNEHDLEETFIKGSGPGGQKINKTASCVVLRHVPSGVVVRCQESRSQHRNRTIARTLLQKKLDEIERGAASLIAREASKARARKARRRRKSVKKHYKSRRDKMMLED